MTALALDSVSVVLGGARVLEEVSWALPAGAWAGLVGPNGAGKSTLLRAVAGLVPYTGGVTIDGRPAEALGGRELARRVAFLPQAPELPSGMTVREYALLGRTPHIAYLGSESRHDRESAERALRSLDLAGPLAERRLHALSGGERQRAVLARALAQEAPLLLLDEPTTALDIGRQQQVLELIDTLRLAEGLTVLSAMHDLTLAGQYADRLLLLSGGRLAASGSPAEVLSPRMVADHYAATVRVIGGAVVPVRS